MAIMLLVFSLTSNKLNAEPAQELPQRHTANYCQPSQTAPGPEPLALLIKGRVLKIHDRIVIEDEATNATYEVDNEEQVRTYVGMGIRANGVLNPANCKVRIVNIETAFGLGGVATVQSQHDFRRLPGFRIIRPEV